ncbi:hypothetical protein D3C78_1405060 [compost metagenome]
MGKVQASLQAMSKALGDKPFCCGTHLSLADIATGCALDWLGFRFPQVDWRNDHQPGQAGRQAGPAHQFQGHRACLSKKNGHLAAAISRKKEVAKHPETNKEREGGEALQEGR